MAAWMVTLPLSVYFDGIANQVVEYLTDTEGIGTVVGLRTADAIELQMQFQSLPWLRICISGTLAEHVGRREIYRVQLHQSVFQLVIIEQGGNEPGEMGGRTLMLLRQEMPCGLST